MKNQDITKREDTCNDSDRRQQTGYVHVHDAAKGLLYHSMLHAPNVMPGITYDDKLNEQRSLGAEILTGFFFLLKNHA